MDLGDAPYGYTPMCSSREDMEGFMFWNQGFWVDHLQGKPYHISALYVVDLQRFRLTRVGDKLRAIYDQLSRDPNSLANLDQVNLPATHPIIAYYPPTRQRSLSPSLQVPSLLHTQARRQSSFLCCVACHDTELCVCVCVLLVGCRYRTCRTMHNIRSQSSPCPRNGSGARLGAPWTPKSRLKPSTWSVPLLNLATSLLLLCSYSYD